MTKDLIKIYLENERISFNKEKLNKVLFDYIKDSLEVTCKHHRKIKKHELKYEGIVDNNNSYKKFRVCRRLHDTCEKYGSDINALPINRKDVICRKGNNSKCFEPDFVSIYMDNILKCNKDIDTYKSEIKVKLKNKIDYEEKLEEAKKLQKIFDNYFEKEKDHVD